METNWGIPRIKQRIHAQDHGDFVGVTSVTAECIDVRNVRFVIERRDGRLAVVGAIRGIRKSGECRERGHS